MSLSTEQFTKAMKALSEPNRVEILRLVGASACEQGVTCSSVLEKMGVSQSTFSHHVSELKEAGLLIGQAEGRMVRLSVNQELLGEVQGALADLTALKT